jgi:two-component system, OmpR family, phosphate regulon sensor histidine kinase PhoR
MKGRLFYKIFGTYLAIAVLAIIVVGILATDQIKARLEKQIEKELMNYAQIIDLYSLSEIEGRVYQIARIAQARVTLIDRGGKVIAETERDATALGPHLDRPEIQEAKVRGRGMSIRLSQTLGEEMMYVAFPVMKGSEITGYIRLARPLAEVTKSIEDLNRILLRSLFIIIISSILVALVFSHKLTLPIRQMEQFTEKVRRGENPGTLMIKSTDEIGQLANNINYMVMELHDRIRSLKEEKAKAEAIFASAIEGVLLIDGNSRIEAVNQGLKNIIGDRYGEITGRTLLEAFRNLNLQKALDQFRSTGLPVSQEIELGEENPVVLDASITPVKSSTDAKEKAMLVLHDVTRLKKLERMRVDFVANVTHEIKTPLTAILGFVETLQEGAIEDKETARKFLSTILRHAERLNRLVDELLVISNIELGEMTFHFEPVSLAGIVESTRHIVELKARNKHISTAEKVPEDLPRIRADRDRLSQILLNILDNAVKFTSEGGHIGVEASEAPGHYVVVKITDTGIGIPRDEIYRLGERFYRVDKTRSRELGGTGLGLSIVKHLMQAHNGRMEIESQMGKGTSVLLYFPIYQESNAFS